MSGEVVPLRGQSAGESGTVAFEARTDQRLAQGFTQIPNIVLRDRRLTAGEKVVYGLLLSFAWGKEHAFPSHATLAACLGASVDTVQRDLQAPHGCGFATPHPCGTKKTQWKKTQGTRHNPPRLRRVGGGLRCPPHLLSRAGRGEGANANRPPCLYASRTPRRTASPRRSTTPAWPLATPRCRHRSRALWPGTPAPCTTSCTRPTR